MRIFARLLAVVAVLLVAATVGLAFLLPRIVDSDTVRDRIEREAKAALGRDVRYAGLEFALLPPSLVIVEPSVAGASADDAPFLEAQGLSLRVALAPLLARTVVVDSLVVEGATVRLIRTKEGFDLPRPGASDTESDGEGGGSSGADSAGAVALALRGLQLTDATLFIEDRAVSPPVTWELGNIDARAQAQALDEPLEFEASMELASGGQIDASGDATLDGALNLELELKALAIDIASPYLDRGDEIAGVMSGRVSASGPATNPDRISVDLDLRDAALRLDDVVVKGPVTVKAELAGGLAAPTGTFAIDATQAEVRYGGAFTKPPGAFATVTGQVVTEADGTIGIDDVKLKMKNMSADVQVRFGERTRVVARAAPFDIAGWDAILPALAGYQLSGRLDPGELRITTNPLDVRGAVSLESLSGVLSGSQPVVFHGGIVGAGDVLRTRDLVMIAGEETIRIDGTVSELGGALRYRFQMNAEAADANRVVSTFTEKRDKLYGVLDFQGEVSGTVGGETEPLRSLDGRLRLDIVDGRIVGMSLLRSTIDAMGGLGSVAAPLAAVFGGPKLEPYYDDSFRSLSGTLDVKRGVARTDDFRMVYDHYAVALQGSLDLVDFSIDMRGSVTLDSELVATLSGGRYPVGTGSARPIEIPLASVRGTLDEPEPTVPRGFASTFGSSLLGNAIDEMLGEGAGDLLGRGLEDLLGGGRRR